MSGFLGFLNTLGDLAEEAVQDIEKEVDGAIQHMDAGIDLDDILESIALAGKDEAALAAAYQKLEKLAADQTPTVLRGWVIDGRVVPKICAALCKVESSRSAAASLARTLNALMEALDKTEATQEELKGFSEQLVRHTENGKAMLKIMQVDDPYSQKEGLALLRRIYPDVSHMLSKNLLSDPASIDALMRILQAAGGSPWAVEGGEVAFALCAECVCFLRLVTQQDGDVRMIVTFQDGVEALLAIVAQALGALRGADASSFIRVAADACVCVLQLASQGQPFSCCDTNPSMSYRSAGCGGSRLRA